MLSANHVIQTLLSLNYSTYTGVPCSFLKPLINGVIGSAGLEYMSASSEGEAVGISLGAHLAGEKTVTMCQNSGFGNMVNPLTSLNYPFRVPTLLVVTWRGQPGIKDEPQHEQMGAITPKLFDTLDIPWRIFPNNPDELHALLEVAEEYINAESRPFGLLMPKATVSDCELQEAQQFHYSHTIPQNNLGATARRLLSRTEVIETILQELSGDEAIVATTGKTGRELFEILDRPNNLYVVGGMGTASAIGLGIAHTLPSQPTVVLDGDGAVLMKMGALATIGLYQPKNLLHIVLDNGVHDSTGGQKTAAGVVDFAAIAAAANYRQAISVNTPAEIKDALLQMRRSPGPHLLHVKMKPGSPKHLGRPTVTPMEVKVRFMRFLADNARKKSERKSIGGVQACV